MSILSLFIELSSLSSLQLSALFPLIEHFIELPHGEVEEDNDAEREEMGDEDERLNAAAEAEQMISVM